jgi:hypothetical protein
MAGQIDYPCWQGWHLILFPMGLAFLMLYSITLPLAALWFLRSKRDAIKTDQLLRCKNTGFDELSNPRFYRFRCVATYLVLGVRRWMSLGGVDEIVLHVALWTSLSSILLSAPSSLCSKSWKNLYQNYKPGKWYWEGVIVARKVRHQTVL